MTEQEKSRPYKEYRDILKTEYDITQLTVMQVDCFCNSMHKLEQQLLSDRDKFAIGFVEWIGLNHWWKCTNTRFPATLGLYTNKINGDFKVEDGKTAPQLLDLYKQSLKTDKA